ncbi:MAG TPA: outer membrane protein assembly factor BamE [Opitutaceae bacterium]
MKPHALLIAPAVLVIAACTSSVDLNRIHIGMTKDQVVAILGTPDSTSAQANVEYLTYYLTSDAGYGRDQPYMIRIVNGTVESFGRAFQLRDLYDRPVTQAQPGSPNFPALGGANALLIPQQGALPVAAPNNDLVQELQVLAKLHSSGALTDDEYAKAKAKVLGQ